MTKFRYYISKHESTQILKTHRHEEAYAALVLKGEYKEISADGIWKCRPGSLVIHPPHHLHGNVFGTTGVRVLNIQLPEISEGKNAGNENIGKLNIINKYAVYRPHDPKHIIRIQNDEHALTQVLRNSDKEPRQTSKHWLDEIASKLISNPGMRIRHLANSYGKSPEHLSRAFQNRYLMGPARFRMEHRFRSAFQKLITSNDSLCEIAYQCGYTDQSHFSREFKAVTGKSPVDARMQ